MTRFKAIVEYNGIFFCGMQKQKIEKDDKPSVQSVLEKALTQLANKYIPIDFCGRTDAGVHAIGQVIDFDLDGNLSEYNIMMGINFFLKKINHQIVIVSVSVVGDDFHARFSCIERTYIYKILNRKIESPIYNNLAYHVHQKIDIEKMQEATKYIIGEKLDFSSFQAKGCQAKTPFKTIREILIEKDDATNIINIQISAQSFLYHMVRNIIGMLIYISTNEDVKSSYMKYILELKNRKYAAKTAPAYGLYFYKAKYDMK